MKDIVTTLMNMTPEEKKILNTLGGKETFKLNLTKNQYIDISKIESLFPYMEILIYIDRVDVKEISVNSNLSDINYPGIITRTHNIRLEYLVTEPKIVNIETGIDSIKVIRENGKISANVRPSIIFGKDKVSSFIYILYFTVEWSFNWDTMYLYYCLKDTDGSIMYVLE